MQSATAPQETQFGAIWSNPSVTGDPGPLAQSADALHLVADQLKISSERSAEVKAKAEIWIRGLADLAAIWEQIAATGHRLDEICRRSLVRSTAAKAEAMLVNEVLNRYGTPDATGVVSPEGLSRLVELRDQLSRDLGSASTFESSGYTPSDQMFSDQTRAAA